MDPNLIFFKYFMSSLQEPLSGRQRPVSVLGVVCVSTNLTPRVQAAATRSRYIYKSKAAGSSLYLSSHHLELKHYICDVTELSGLCFWLNEAFSGAEADILMGIVSWLCLDGDDLRSSDIETSSAQSFVSFCSMLFCVLINAH
jgi:hypothetical protein